MVIILLLNEIKTEAYNIIVKFSIFLISVLFKEVENAG